MAVDIARFLSGIPSPVDRLQEGVAFGAGLADRRASRQAAEASAAQQEALSGELAALANNPNKTPDDYLSLMTRFPDLADKFKVPLEQLNTEQRQTTLGEATSVYAALAGGRTGIALDILQDRKEAAENSGDEQAAQSADIMMETIKFNPEAAMTTTGLFLANALGPEQFQKMVGTLATANKESGREQEITDMMQTFGLNRPDAIAVQSGNMKVEKGTAPNEFYLVDTITGRIRPIGGAQEPTQVEEVVTEQEVVPDVEEEAPFGGIDVIEEGTGPFQRLASVLERIPLASVFVEGGDERVANQVLSSLEKDFERAFVNNPRFPVAEVETIRKKLLPATGIISTPEALISDLTATRDIVEKRVEEASKTANDRSLQASIREDDKNIVVNGQKFLSLVDKILGSSEKVNVMINPETGEKIMLLNNKWVKVHQ